MSRRNLISFVALFALVALLAPATTAFAAKTPKPVTDSQTVTVKAEIDAIDHSTRMVTLKDKDGNYETLYAGPEIKRFDELKVGDKVTFKYTDAVVLKVKKPGEPVAASGPSEPAVVRGTGKKPSGTMTQQETAVVKVKAIDPKRPAVTVETEDGHSMSFKVEKKSLLKDLKVGDRIEITYTSALAVSVE